MNPSVLVVMLVCGVATYMLAARKNKLAIVWAIFGALFPLATLIVLAFAPPLCHKCKQPLSGKKESSGICPKCGCALS